MLIQATDKLFKILVKDATHSFSSSRTHSYPLEESQFPITRRPKGSSRWLLSTFLRHFSTTNRLVDHLLQRRTGFGRRFCRGGRMVRTIQTFGCSNGQPTLKLWSTVQPSLKLRLAGRIFRWFGLSDSSDCPSVGMSECPNVPILVRVLIESFSESEDRRP